MSDETVIAIVEDDPNIADLVELYLRRDGYRAYQADDGERGARDQSPSGQPSLVHPRRRPRRRDRRARGLPSSCATSDVPIIMLTARDDEIDRVLGLELGADDYVTKPFSPRELVARVKAILRRTDGSSDRTVPRRSRSVDDIIVDTGRREVTLEATPSPSPAEFDLLRHLGENRGLALSRRQLLDGVWGHDWVGDDRTVDVHVRQLRKKLGDDLPLTTVWGVGYRLD